MTKIYPKATNIKVRFGRDVVLLKDVRCTVKTRAGVVIWMKSKPGGEFQAMADIPDGTLEQYKHMRPVVESVDWV